jgi:hypothetical protein
MPPSWNDHTGEQHPAVTDAMRPGRPLEPCAACPHPRSAHVSTLHYEAGCYETGCRRCACRGFTRGAVPDLNAIVTPTAKRRAVVAALRERATLGDTLARGAIEVIEALEVQANQLAWHHAGVCP